MELKCIRLLAVCLVLILPESIPAAETTVDSTTIIRFEQRSVPGFAKERLIPATEFIAIDSSKLGDGNLSFHLYGWGRGDLADRSAGEKSTDGNLSSAYLGYRFPTANGTVKAGRFFVYEGVAAEQIDGAATRVDLTGGMTAALFAGVPTKTDAASGKGDYILGGRFSYRMAGVMELGISGLQEGGVAVTTTSGLKEDRRLVGGDLWLAPTRSAELNSRVVYNATTQGLAEATGLLTVRPLPAVTLSGEYNQQNFKDYFTFSTIRSLFNPDTGDKVTYWGGSATYAVAAPAEFVIDYRHYNRETTGSADRFGGDLRFTFPASKVRAGGSYHRLSSALDVDSYHELRGYLLRDSGRYTGSLDAIVHLFDAAIYGRTSAYEFIGSLGYRVLENLSLSGDISYGQNPSYGSEVKGLMRLTYNYASAMKGAGK